MNTFPRKPLALLCLAFAILPSTGSANAFRDFVSSDGQVITARYINTEDDRVYLERSDGLRFAAPLARFDGPTQGFILFSREQAAQRLHNVLLSGNPIPARELSSLHSAGLIREGNELLITGMVTRVTRSGPRGENFPIYRVSLTSETEVQINFREETAANHRTYLVGNQKIILDEYKGIPGDRLNPVRDLLTVGQEVNFVGRLEGLARAATPNQPMVLSGARIPTTQHLQAHRIKMASARSPGDFEKTVRIEELRTEIALLEEEIRTGVVATSTGRFRGSSNNVYGESSVFRGTTDSVTRYTPAQIEAKKSELVIKRAQLNAYLAG